jgi:hypothetical protein
MHSAAARGGGCSTPRCCCMRAGYTVAGPIKKQRRERACAQSHGQKVFFTETQPLCQFMNRDAVGLLKISALHKKTSTKLWLQILLMLKITFS